MVSAAMEFTRGSAWAAHSASTAPTWVTALATAACVLVVMCVVWLIAVAVGAAGANGDKDDRDEGPGGGGGRGGPPSPDRSGGDCPGGEPAWWPEFELQFAAYVAGRKVGSLQAADLVASTSCLIAVGVVGVRGRKSGDRSLERVNPA
jgi:hypothetical protein